MVVKSRNWCFTLNNPSVHQTPELWNLEQVSLLIYQHEMGENQTPHLQGYLELKSPRALSYLRGLCGNAHWEIRRGSKEQAFLYCVKPDSQISPPCLFWKNEWLYPDSEKLECISTWLDSIGLSLTRKSGSDNSATKARLEEIKDKLQDGSASIESVADEDFDLWVRYYKAFEKYLMIKTKPRNHDVVVEVLQGPTGTGKSKWALDNYPDAYWKQRSNWWDGYFNHKTVVIDEFYGWLPFDLLLRVCDRYPLLVETKGGQVQFVADRIIITTNHAPSTWYKSVYFPAFVRRVTKWHVLPIFGEHEEYEDYEQAMVAMNRNILNF
jgi:hypothetical protein